MGSNLGETFVARKNLITRETDTSALLGDSLAPATVSRPRTPRRIYVLPGSVSRRCAMRVLMPTALPLQIELRVCSFAVEKAGHRRPRAL